MNEYQSAEKMIQSETSETEIGAFIKYLSLFIKKRNFKSS